MVNTTYNPRHAVCNFVLLQRKGDGERILKCNYMYQQLLNITHTCTTPTH